MKAKELRDFSVTDIEKRLREAREEMLKLRLGRQTGQVEKTHTIRVQRKDIARMETLLAEKKRSAAAPAAAK